MNPPPPPPSSSRPTPESDDNALVEAARSGDRTALEALLGRHHDRIVTVSRRLCRNPTDAEDAAQEAMIAIVRGLDRFDGRSQFSTWVYRVTTNACLDELRRRKRRPEPTDAAHAPELIATGSDPAEVALRAEERSELAAVLDELPEEFRVPLVLRDVADLDYATIGEVLGRAPGTVRSRIARARARVARAVPHLDPTSPPNTGPGNQDPSLDVGTPQ